MYTFFCARSRFPFLKNIWREREREGERERERTTFQRYYIYDMVFTLKSLIDLCVVKRGRMKHKDLDKRQAYEELWRALNEWMTVTFQKGKVSPKKEISMFHRKYPHIYTNDRVYIFRNLQSGTGNSIVYL